MKLFKIDKKLGKKWVAALRSGKYMQGKDHLYDSEREDYCCLGILGICEGIPKKRLIGYDLLSHIDESNLGKILGAQKSDYTESITYYSAEDVLARLNDGDKGKMFKHFNLPDQRSFSFEQIADFIEQNFEFTD